GTSIAISTGAVVPEGADAVVPVERTDGGAEAVAVEAVAPGDNVRPRGGDVHAGDVVVAAGSAIGPVQIGALAGSGVSTVRCGCRPRAPRCRGRRPDGDARGARTRAGRGRARHVGRSLRWRARPRARPPRR